MALKLKGDTPALQVVATGAQSYQNYSDIKGGALFKAEAGIGFNTNENQKIYKTHLIIHMDLENIVLVQQP